jgi:hypothetical protein
MPPEVEPRSHQGSLPFNSCVLYELGSYEKLSLYRYSIYDYTEYGWYAYDRVRYYYVDFPWQYKLERTALNYVQAGYGNYWVSYQSYVGNWGDGWSWIQNDNTTLVERTGGPSFSAQTHIWSGSWDRHQEWSTSRVPSYAYGRNGYLWNWHRGHKHWLRNAFHVC